MDVGYDQSVQMSSEENQCCHQNQDASYKIPSQREGELRKKRLRTCCGPHLWHRKRTKKHLPQRLGRFYDALEGATPVRDWEEETA